MEDKYYCRSCKGPRKFKVICEKKTKGSEELDFIQWNDDYYIIECLGCETTSFLQIYGDSEMVEFDDEGERYYVDRVDIYPKFLEKGNEIEQLYYLPDKIGNIYRETISAFKANAYILTAGGFRAIIEALCNHLKIRKDDLSKRIDLLYDKGFLSLNESKRLHSIRFLGNDALHEMETPKKEQLFIILEIINHLLENLFIQDKKIGNKIDRVIDNYEDFLKLIRNKINKDMINREMNLDEILSKSKRLIKNTVYKNLENNLIEEVEGGKIKFLTVVKKEDSVYLKIEKLPELSFDF
jgi:hypothetical protein